MDREAALLEEEKKFIADPNLWPRWPMLPLKRRNRQPDPASDKNFGVIVEGQGCRVFYTYVHDPKINLDNSELYDTVDDLLKVWTID